VIPAALCAAEAAGIRYQFDFMVALAGQLALER
jgi:hypothetical protein